MSGGGLRGRLAEEARATGLPLGRLILLAVLLHVGVTLLAVNPWHPDEHFQILEFAWARAGLSPLADLPWEFPARIRPTLQPTLAIGALRALQAVGVTSPYPWVLALRLGTLGLALAVLLRVCTSVGPELGRAGRRALWGSAFFFWFAPLFLSRFTSENWGGLALAAALPLVQRAGASAAEGEPSPHGGRDAWGAGALLGLSFVLRFQMAFATGALVLWLLLRGRRGVGAAARATAAAALVVAAAAVCDAWFYGGWVFTPWEYLRTNLIEGVASTFGTEPWYWYALQAPLWMAPPLGLAIAGLCLVGAVARPRSPWVWAFVAFGLGHTLIAHKELRFLFPMLYLMPVLLAFGVDALAAARPLGAARRPIVGFLIAQNALLAAALLTPSIHRGKEFDWHYYRFLWKAADARPEQPLFVLQSGDSPYRVWDLEDHVYRPATVHPVAYAPGTPLAALVPAGTPPDAVLVVTRDASPPPLAGAHGFDLVYAAEPGYRTIARTFGLEHSRLLAWLERVDRWTDSEWVRRVYRVSAMDRRTRPS